MSLQWEACNTRIREYTWEACEYWDNPICPSIGKHGVLDQSLCSPSNRSLYGAACFNPTSYYMEGVLVVFTEPVLHVVMMGHNIFLLCIVFFKIDMWNEILPNAVMYWLQ